MAVHVLQHVWSSHVQSGLCWTRYLESLRDTTGRPYLKAKAGAELEPQLAGADTVYVSEHFTVSETDHAKLGKEKASDWLIR